MTQVSNERRAATASYIEGMLVELRAMSEDINAELLVYLIEMAAVEANDVKIGRIKHCANHDPDGKTKQSITAEELAAKYMAKNA